MHLLALGDVTVVRAVARAPHAVERDSVHAAGARRGRAARPRVSLPPRHTLARGSLPEYPLLFPAPPSSSNVSTQAATLSATGHLHPWVLQVVPYHPSEQPGAVSDRLTIGALDWGEQGHDVGVAHLEGLVRG